MRTLKTTMLFLGISVTSFAQNFVGLDSVRLDNGDDVFSSILKTKKQGDDDADFKKFSLESAMRGMEDEPDFYDETQVVQK